MDEKKKYNEALKRAMSLCAKREFCRQEIDNRLENMGIDAPSRRKIIEQLISGKFIDEDRYARAFVNDKFRYNKWGKIKIAAMLRAKGLSEEAIQRALDLIDDGQYTEILRKIIANHKKSVKSANPFELKGKLARYAVSKGFESHLVYELLENEE